MLTSRFYKCCITTSIKLKGCARCVVSMDTQDILDYRLNFVQGLIQDPIKLNERPFSTNVT